MSTQDKEQLIDRAWELMAKLDRRDILEITVASASTRNLMEDLIEIYGDDCESLNELIDECNDIIQYKESLNAKV